MKTIILFLCLVVSFAANAQCETIRYARPYLALPSFFGLYFAGQCISQPLRDTTICVKVVKTNQTQVAAFSYSSPSGLPAFITNVRQYNNACIMYEQGSMIPAGNDTITICYDISASLIDNFCPYTILSGSLSVDWCGIYAYYSDEHIKMRWLTCSNSGTKKFDIITSSDAQNWLTLVSLKPIQETSSTELEYKVCIPFHKSGINYFAIREEDLNGNVKVSDIVYCDVPTNGNQATPQYDLLGRSVGSSTFMFYVGK
jgi:hypothetical protein